MTDQPQQPWAAARYASCLAFSFGYAIVSLLLFWLFNLPSKLGNYDLFADLSQMQRFSILTLFGLLSYILYYKQRHFLTRTLSPSYTTPTRYNAYLYNLVASLGVCMMLPASLATTINPASFVGIFAFCIIVAFACSFLFILAYSINRALAITQPIRVALILALFIGLLCNILFTITFDELIGSTVPIASTIAGAGLLAYCIHTFSIHNTRNSTLLIFWFSYNLWYFTCIVGILATESTGWQLYRDSPAWLGLLILLGPLPLLQAFWLWLCFGLTHNLLNDIQSLSLRVIVHHLIAFGLSIGCTLGLIASLVAFTCFSNLLTLTSHSMAWLDLPNLLRHLSQNPFNPHYFWLYALLLTPLIPGLHYSWRAARSLLINSKIPWLNGNLVSRIALLNPILILATILYGLFQIEVNWQAFNICTLFSTPPAE